MARTVGDNPEGPSGAAGTSDAPGDNALEPRASGEGPGDGLLDLASSCKKGMGEKRGVEGGRDAGFDADEVKELNAALVESVAVSGTGGNMSQVDVTRTVRSIARRYFPTDL